MNTIPCGTEGCTLDARLAGGVSVGEVTNGQMGEALSETPLYICADGHSTWARP